MFPKLKEIKISDVELTVPYISTMLENKQANNLGVHTDIQAQQRI